MKLLNVRNLSAKIGNFELKSINFSVEKGEIFVIVGENGAGKTKLLDAIAGFLPLTSGDIFLSGENITRKLPQERNMGYIFQSLALFPHLTVRENILYGAKLRKLKDAEEKFEEVVSFFRIEKLLDRKPASLSGGEKQKVALARTLILRPKIILFDEPTSALSPGERLRVDEEIKKTLKKFGITAVFVSHNMEEAYFFGGRVGVMQNGKLVQIGTPDEIKYKPASEFVAFTFGEVNIFTCAVKESANGVSVARCGNFEIKFLGDFEIGRKLKLAVRPEDIVISPKQAKTSARNVIRGKISEILSRGPLVKVVINCGNKVSVYVSKQSFEELNLNRGKEVSLRFKITAPHVLPDK